MSDVGLEKVKSFRQQMLIDILATKDKNLILAFLVEYGLEIRDSKILPKVEYEDLWDASLEFYDRKQHSTKISLNSVYGALLNKGSRFFDKRLGQSTTLTGRTITRHMCAKTNELISGEYDYRGKAVIAGDTDSSTFDTVIRSSIGDQTIEELFNGCPDKWADGEKEYAYDEDLMVMSYDKIRDEPYFGHIEYIYRHRVSKDMYEIEDELGNTVTVTTDHSVMVERDGELIEVKPHEINMDDILISLKV